jgi:uncharacterized repeat protein (TIGR03803 family)
MENEDQMPKHTTQVLLRRAATLITLALSLVWAVNAWAGNVPVSIWFFGNSTGIGANIIDGNTPFSTPIFDSAGNLYGTTADGGANGFGIVFKLTPTSSGLWKETILHSFKGSPGDGATPYSTLFRDSAGNLYGTTFTGGLKTKNPECSAGCGVVFKLTPTAKGPWKETILYRFKGGADGASPHAGLIQDKAGNFYGTASGGGNSTGTGTVFKLTLTSTGWKETILHSFGIEVDGAVPFASLVFDSAGNLYGTTVLGGEQNLGTVFKMTPQTSGTWTETVLHSLQGGNDGLEPYAPVVLDKEGNVYAASQALNEQLPCGAVFKLTAANNYAETILHSFEGTFNNNDGCIPNGLVFDTSGNLFGTSVFGGTDSAGTIFKLTPDSAGGFSYSVLYSFLGDQTTSTDGEFPFAPMAFGPNGELFGTAIGGPDGNFPGAGVVFEFKP